MSSKTSSPHSPENMAAVIRAAWEQGAITQAKVQQDLGIHQSQFSKLVNGQFKEARGHALRLFEYSIRRTVQPEQVADNADTLRTALTIRLMRAWDGTAEGANALEAILEGAARLRARPQSR